MVPSPRSSGSGLASSKTVTNPMLAKFIAIPPPIVPVPTTPILRIGRGDRCCRSQGPARLALGKEEMAHRARPTRASTCFKARCLQPPALLETHAGRRLHTFHDRTRRGIGALGLIDLAEFVCKVVSPQAAATDEHCGRRS